MTPGSLNAVIAQVVPSIDRRWGGTSVSVPALVEAMYGRDQHLRLFFGQADHRSSWPEYYVPCADDAPMRWRRSRELKNALRNTPCRVVHHHALWLPSLGYAYRAAKHWQAPLVISPRGMLSAYARRRSRFKKAVANWLIHPCALASAAGWHATSEQERDDIRAAGFKAPVAIAPNGFDHPPWNEASDRSAWLEKHPELFHKRILLFFARWHSKKGIEWLLQWWASKQRSFADWHLLVAGLPDEYSGEQLNNIAAQHGIGSRVTIADAEGLAKPYRLAEVYVLPSSSENFGLTIAEALSAGLPVITTHDTPWEALNAIDAGACVALSQLGDRLQNLLTLSPDQLREMGRRGQEYVEQNFSWDRQAAALLDFYETLK